MNPIKKAELQTRIKSLIPLFIFILVILITILLCIFASPTLTLLVCIILLILSTIGKYIVFKLGKTASIRLNIDDKVKTLKSVYKAFNLQNHNTIVAINTKDYELIKKAKNEFPGSNETKNPKGLYSLMLPKAPLKELSKFIETYNPEYLLLHNFSTIEVNNKKGRTHTVSICIEKDLTIKYSKKSFTQEEISNIIKEIKSK